MNLSKPLCGLRSHVPLNLSQRLYVIADSDGVCVGIDRLIPATTSQPDILHYLEACRQNDTYEDYEVQMFSLGALLDMCDLALGVQLWSKLGIHQVVYKDGTITKYR